MSSAKGNTDQIGKVFVVRRHGLRECLDAECSRTTLGARDVTAPRSSAVYTGGNREGLRMVVGRSTVRKSY